MRLRVRTIVLVAALASMACTGNGCSCGPHLNSGASSCGAVDIGGNAVDAGACEAAGGYCSDLACGPTAHTDPSYSCGGALFGPVCCFPGADCAEIGGVCQSSCGSAGHLSGACGVGRGVCCAPGPDASVDAGEDAGAIGSCNGTPCFPGCACESSDGGTTCACDTDAGTDASADASDLDASVDADDASASDAEPLDASTDADASTSMACGVITCVEPCVCTDPQRSACLCP